MKINQLKAFAQVYACRSYSKAADVLGVSQPAISQSVKTLEDELGTVLLTKSNGKLALTAAGDIVYNATKRIMNEIDAMNAHLADLNRTTMLYHMNSSALAVQRELIPFMQSKKAPFLLQYDIVSERDCIETLLAGQVDIIATQHYLENDLVCCKKVAQDGLNICLPENSKLAKHPRLTLKDIEGEIVVLNKNYVGGSINELIINTATAKQITLDILFQPDFMLYRQAQESSEYSFFTSDITKKHESEILGRVYIPLTDEEFNISYYISYLKKNSERLQPITKLVDECFDLT